MAGSHYPQDAIDYWLGALMASAAEVDGERVPNFHAVERQAKKGQGPGGRKPTWKTLAQWWEARDVERDPELIQAATRGREAMAEAGSREWIEGAWEGIAGLIDIVVKADNYDTEDGRFADARTDSIARAAKLVAETMPALQQRLDGKNEGGRQSLAHRADDIARKARAAGLIK